MIDYAHELEIRVVAEGIETEPELATVCELGADLGQGWYLGRPAADAAVVPRSLVLDARDTSLRGRAPVAAARLAPCRCPDGRASMISSRS